jgi:enolase
MIDSSDFAITEISAYEILDSRGDPTLRVCVSTKKARGCANVPSGLSKGKHEVEELRDGIGKLGGKGVSKAVETVKDYILQALVGEDVREQQKIDRIMMSLDGTEDKSKLGGNTMLGVSLAVARTAAILTSQELYSYLGGVGEFILPVPFLNIINGGKHVSSGLDFQEFMIVPVGFDTFKDAIWASSEVYHKLKEIIKEKYGGIHTSVGDEGGFTPPIRDPEAAVILLEDAIKASGYAVGDNFYIAIDAASSNFYNEEKGVYTVNGKNYRKDELLEFYLKLIDAHPVKSIEDPFYEEDFESFSELNSKLRKKGVLVVGDDLLTTNPKRLEKALEKGSVSGVIVKPNQIGTLTETIRFSEMAMHSGIKAIVSHRSGETDDPFIADLSVALRNGAIKAGAPCRGERTSKYNRLIEIESLLSGYSEFAGRRFFI